MSPVTSGHTNKRLCPKGSGAGRAPYTCSTVKGPRLLTEGTNIVVVASLNNWPGMILEIPNTHFSALIICEVGAVPG